MTRDELNKVLLEHERWLERGVGVKKAQKKNPLGGNLMSSAFKKTFKVIISRKEAKNNGNA